MTFEPPAVPLDAARAAFLEACALDVSTPKPGNVSAQSPGHGMDAAQFLASADASLEALFAPGARVGQRILDAVTRTRAAAGCNTNLGIVLLVAPLAAALDQIGTMDAKSATALTAPRWRTAVAQVLAKLDVEDARLAYRAIALANPGGLGDAPEQSVHAAPTIGLRDAMHLAAERDSIARQYANGFADLFDTGLAAFAQAPADAPQAAMLNVFLAFLAGWPDSHIVRKHGLALAQSVTLAAREQHARWRATALEEARRAATDPRLDAWDVELKSRAINPGTSADLAVATLFVARVLENAGRSHAAIQHG
ncbi:triphosphoribosyl-dephospho-CoA synthase [Burkholderia sp. SRS-W-2-2016]|uniref:triphosphoribosyl-dephospho-CoA synthase n=1 Tax=Burkholderia sp. SRS-W-2-2016 TaxID=1926878 RepID=UPI00094B15D4|nr:triphosphoribosyl-dephospho-CoA synthase [Burkholderia sp. SRS-W-2-2016]OLL31522.1 triphosphoribosyl-dephospho-CoA synthase [Burkholderia sp. SRS-W-2-2016]